LLGQKACRTARTCAWGVYWVATVEFFISTCGSLVLAVITGFLSSVIREGNWCLHLAADRPTPRLAPLNLDVGKSFVCPMLCPPLALIRAVVRARRREIVNVFGAPPCLVGERKKNGPGPSNRRRTVVIRSCVCYNLGPRSRFVQSRTGTDSWFVSGLGYLILRPDRAQV
jgi:hypothetical protein